MPKVTIRLSEHAMQVVDVVKRSEGLRGTAEGNVLDPMFRPELIEHLRRIRRSTFRMLSGAQER